ncbi:hypothetical protein SAMN06273570_1732 [Candidatus Pantoea floridensis]|uniref:Uncharacterized protein n=1 Tax=Candidatus Pantoea floridensis TaxID=1938870 RepID=A0A286BTA9_9GAMM|nr:hypothetical protein BX596_3410 [Enterobacteriaceae bacterium JKS000233]SOD37379.1 hypothetical protein SAMN06273570_1732 [Pantoea floridensis]
MKVVCGYTRIGCTHKSASEHAGGLKAAPTAPSTQAITLNSSCGNKAVERSLHVYE